jgi:hypothetical protein
MARAEVRRWEDFLRSYDELTGVVPKSQIQSPGPQSYVATRDFEMPLDIGSAPRNKAENTKTLASKVLAERGGFVPTRELLGELIELGDDIGGKDPVATLSSRLIGAKDIENIRPHGWRLKPRQTNEAAGPTTTADPAASGSTADIPSAEPTSTPSRAVEPVPGGGT